jgi:hypothetical protein
VDVGVRRARVGPVTQTPHPAYPVAGGAGIQVLDDHIYQRLLRERIVFLGGVEDHANELETGMAATVQRLKAVAER